MSNIGRVRKWLHFDGVDDYVKTNFTYDITQGVTLIQYFKPLKTNTGGQEFANFFINAVTTRADIMEHKGNLKLYLKQNGIGGVFVLEPCIANKDYFIAEKIYSDESNTYVDVQINENTYHKSVASVEHADYPFNIAMRDNNDMPYPGKFDMYFVAIYDHRLDDEEITQIRNYIMNGNGEMITDGLMLWYDGDSIDEGAGIWRDKSENGNDGTIYGAKVISNSSVAYRNWLHFDGVDDYVRATVDNFTSYDNITIATYFIIDSPRDVYGNPQRIFSSPHGRIEILFYDDILKFQFKTADGLYHYTECNASIGEKIFAALTIDSENLIAKTYKNKTLIKNESLNSKPETGFSDDVYIGFLWSTNDRFLHGDAYSIIAHNRALSDAEISQLYDYVVKGKGNMIIDGLMLWYDGESIDENNGIWKDKSGNGNDGIIYGAKKMSNINPNL